MSQRLMARPARPALALSCRPRAPSLRGGRCDFNIAPGLSANRRLCGPAKNRRQMDVENRSMHEFATYSQFVQSKWAAGSGIWTIFSPRVVLIFGQLSTRLINVRWRQAHRLFFWGNL